MPPSILMGGGIGRRRYSRFITFPFCAHIPMRARLFSEYYLLRFPWNALWITKRRTFVRRFHFLRASPVCHELRRHLLQDCHDDPATVFVVNCDNRAPRESEDFFVQEFRHEIRFSVISVSQCEFIARLFQDPTKRVAFDGGGRKHPHRSSAAIESDPELRECCRAIHCIRGSVCNVRQLRVRNRGPLRLATSRSRPRFRTLHRSRI